MTRDALRQNKRAQMGWRAQSTRRVVSKVVPDPDSQGPTKLPELARQLWKPVRLFLSELLQAEVQPPSSERRVLMNYPNAFAEVVSKRCQGSRHCALRLL